MYSSSIIRQFSPGMVRPIPLNELLSGDQIRKVLNGTPEERQAAILALDPDKRMKVLANVPPNVVAGTAGASEEQATARQKQQEKQRIEMRRLRPRLNELLESWQCRSLSAERRNSAPRSSPLWTH